MEAPVEYSSDLQGHIEHGSQERLEKKMRISHPDPVTSTLEVIPPIVPLPRIRYQLKQLAYLGFQRHGNEFQISTGL